MLKPILLNPKLAACVRILVVTQLYIRLFASNSFYTYKQRQNVEIISKFSLNAWQKTVTTLFSQKQLCKAGKLNYKSLFWSRSKHVNQAVWVQARFSSAETKWALPTLNHLLILLCLTQICHVFTQIQCQLQVKD